MFTWFKGRLDQTNLANQGTTQQGAQTLLTPGAQLDAFDATTGKIVWVWGIPNDTGYLPDGHLHVQGEAVPRQLPRRRDCRASRVRRPRASATS